MWTREIFKLAFRPPFVYFRELYFELSTIKLVNSANRPNSVKWRENTGILLARK